VNYKVLIILSLSFLIFFSSPPIAEAHPGRTDASGGHTCRTNCESWGLGYGEYHYHGGGGASSGSSGGSAGETTSPELNPAFLEYRQKILSPSPTITPTPTITSAPSPTVTKAPTQAPTKKVIPVQSSVVQKPQGFFEWLFSFFRGK
jgi:hypothetical protein